jgi:hypothetical protein
MALTRRRIIDVMAAASGVALLLLALLIVDQRTRFGVSGGVDAASVGENLNYLAMAVSLLAAQVVRGDIADNMLVVVFMTTAVVLVVLLMRI